VLDTLKTGSEVELPDDIASSTSDANAIDYALALNKDLVCQQPLNYTPEYNRSRYECRLLLD